MTSTTTSSKTLEELPATGTNGAFAGVIRGVFEDFTNALVGRVVRPRHQGEMLDLPPVMGSAKHKSDAIRQEPSRRLPLGWISESRCSWTPNS
jgi:hypothetical protein